MEYYDENLNSLTSRTFEKRPSKFNGTEALVGINLVTYLKNLVKCAALTIVRELSWGKHLVSWSHTVYGTITEVCRDYAIQINS